MCVLQTNFGDVTLISSMGFVTLSEEQQKSSQQTKIVWLVRLFLKKTVTQTQCNNEQWKPAGRIINYNSCAVIETISVMIMIIIWRKKEGPDKLISIEISMKTNKSFVIFVA